MMLEKKTTEFLEVLSSAEPVPGGGGASAAVGAFASALGMMVANLTVGKKKYADVEEEIQSGKNIGMANVNQRIRLFYGEEYGIQMESRQGEGTEVEIILPIRKYSENMKNLSGEEKEDDLSGSDCR